MNMVCTGILGANVCSAINVSTSNEKRKKKTEKIGQFRRSNMVQIKIKKIEFIVLPNWSKNSIVMRRNFQSPKNLFFRRFSFSIVLLACKSNFFFDIFRPKQRKKGQTSQEINGMLSKDSSYFPD